MAAKKAGGGRRNLGLGGVLAAALAAFTVLVVLGIGAALALALAETANIKNQENFQEVAPALPTKLLDINGNTITEFVADEKRELITLAQVPRHLIHAALAREDPEFYHHKGFSVRGILRAVYGRLSGHDLGGGSTITQQVAGQLGYVNRNEISYTRKIKEIWWAIQLERRYTKDEILEMYLNYTYMGSGVYGVEAASKFYFGHSVRDISLAESALLVILFSAPSRYNPLDNPNTAMDRQRAVLDKMIEFGYATPEESEESFVDYWTHYDYTRVSQAAYFHRDDLAPWFSEYVRRQLDDLMYGTMDYYRDGYTVHTTLDMKFQQAAEKYMVSGIARANREYRSSAGNRLTRAEETYIPIVNLLSLYFDMNILRGTSEARNELAATTRYTKVINPMLDMAGLLFGVEDLRGLTAAGFEELKVNTEANVVEGALVVLENETGYIKAVVGGSKYDQNNQFIRATQGRLQPGSSFKPLYYSAAIDSRLFTPSTLIWDQPVVYHNEDGTPYIPLNFRGEFSGSVLLYQALAQSMNVPSIKILDTIGFDLAINRASALLGVTDPEEIRRVFPRIYPLGLGIVSVSPLQMAKAFATFANEGREVTPLAIRSIEDRNGRVIMDLERDLRQEQRKRGEAMQVISAQNAYIMTTLLKKTTEVGTLAGQYDKLTYRDAGGKRYHIAVAGKTGTTQNWADAWTVGFTPYYTTAIWFGFDKPGNSLGLTLTGATLAGPVWGDFMREVHAGLTARDFVRPESGLVDVKVCAKSGQLPTPDCPEVVTLTFLDDAHPTEYCTMHGNGTYTARSSLRSPQSALFDNRSVLEGLSMPRLDLSQLPSGPPSARRDAENTSPPVQENEPIDWAAFFGAPSGSEAEESAALDEAGLFAAPPAGSEAQDSSGSSPADGHSEAEAAPPAGPALPEVTGGEAEASD